VKLNFNKITQVYFLGIGGIGMSALARYFNAIGKVVSGYDKTPTKLTDELISEGINVHFDDNIRLIPASIKELPYKIENILIVYTPAIPGHHNEYFYFKENGFVIKKRAEVLGMITENSNTVAVAGTHGKTTTS
jgi:UDP-N-acetylmuramate--alanine ligase